ncbi:tetratricopeptide repeat protein [Pseudomonas nunensis]|uniref:Tetratricopeptide repeat protein n=1 Tax=Pseudomonas nunensis TaxID=2961896 RepID=A0ABY5EGS7_9PSED|nr:tetratricopeptide repeat protein [Pseudomonas nunensis]KPN88340.1 hypothetical protein AL066_29385 [Pseudomonas nunensis]MCL5226011.1 tetratricopeptide repeat protein [Pseudomonas nunensis]UTO13992.1 tetratricopeptide repeat protein [Pseudomonas nunensis]
MFDKYKVVSLLFLLVVRPCSAGEESLVIDGVQQSSLMFRSFDKKYGGWSDIEYKGSGGTFRLYALPNKTGPSEEGVVGNSDVDMVSPDKKYVIVQRTNAGETVDEQGKNIISEQAYCDVVSLESGCVENIGSVNQCDGAWQGQNWKVAEGEIFNFSKGGVSPRQLISKVSNLSSDEFRASSLRDWIFMGVPSYMACYPPEKNISEYNDIGFYFAQGGEHLLAMQIYNKLLSFAPDRVPLKLNIADSLWALGKKEEAISFYADYRDSMLKKGNEKKVPARVEERLH